ncbi:MAG: AcrB/AcrD/AcrF family protein [Planctomycetes bacterium]|nr:AcrB/AcrD/AcrF family protein [Planctomycetota bacterium]
MKFARWAHSHHRSILFLLAALAAAGVYGGLNLPVGLFPHVDFPRVVVSLDAGDRPAERMAIEVTWPVEQAVRAVPGVRSVRSATSRGSAEVSINFDWGRDMVSSMLQVESAVNQIVGSLPAGAEFEVRRMDPTVFPVLGFSLVSDTQSLVAQRDLALYQIRPVLSTVRGVSQVLVQGGQTAEYQVIVDPARLDAHGMSLDDVAKALSAANIVSAVGRTEDHDKLYLILADTQFEAFDQIGATVLRSGDNGLVRLEDVATVSRGAMPQWTRVTADGHEAVLFQVYQQPGGNTVKIAREVAAKLAEIRERLPKDVRIAKWYDQSELIVASATSVRDAVMIGVGLAALILLAFLRNIKVTLIAAVTVPMVLSITVLLLYALGMSFNIMTLGGMAAAVALIIDDAIVMIEHIIRRLRGGSGHYHDRVNAAAAEFTRPLTGSSASTIIIFAPLAFLTGVTGAFFKALSLTMAASLIISYVIAWLAVPLLATHLLRQHDADEEEGGPITDRMHRVYQWTMRRLLPRPWLILLAIIPLLGAGYFGYQQVGTGFMPSMDEGGFILDYVAEPGTSLTETDRMLRELESIIQSVPEVRTYSRRTGLQLGGGLTEANEGDFFIKLKPQPRRSLDDVMDDIRTRVEHRVPGLEIELAKLMEDLIGDLTAVPQPIEIKIFSDDGKLLEAAAPQVADAIGKVDGVVDVKDGIVLAGDAMVVRVDRVKAALEGVEPASITDMLGSDLSGIVTTQIQQGPAMVGLRVWIPRSERTTVSNLEHLRLRAPDGHLFPLSRVASVQVVTGQPQIMRDDLKRMVAVTARITGRDMGSTLHDIIGVLARPGVLPAGTYYTLGGLYAEQVAAFRGLLIVFSSAVALVFTLLLFLYESFRAAIAMMITTLVGFAAVFIGLWFTDTELNITAMMGMTMIVGIVTEVAIFYYSEYHDLPAADDPAARFIAAGVNRMRPILMTTLAAILALLPLAMGLGEGSAMLQPLAIGIIAGLIVQPLLVLIVLPTLLVTLRVGHQKSSPHQ